MNNNRTWKNEASTPRRQRILNMRPMTLTKMTGVRLFAVLKSSVGISTLGDTKAAAWSNRTAITSWIKRKSKGRSGDEFNTALLLRTRGNINIVSYCTLSVLQWIDSHTKTICEKMRQDRSQQRTLARDIPPKLRSCRTARRLLFAMTSAAVACLLSPLYGRCVRGNEPRSERHSIRSEVTGRIIMKR